MMKKLLLIVLSALMFFMGFNSYAKNIDESKINKISGLVNSDLEDKVLEIQGAKKDAAKALFIPAREVFTKLNFDIYWNGEDKSCFFKKGIKNIKVKLGSKNYITSNNNKIELDYAPMLVDMKMYLPIDVLYYLLDYDTFVVADTIYIRNAIDGIKTGIVNEAKYSLAYPVFFSTEDVKRAYRNKINEQIKKFVDEHVEKAKNDAKLKKMYFTYDIARSDERLVSLCFYINSVYNDDSTNS